MKKLALILMTLIFMFTLVTVSSKQVFAKEAETEHTQEAAQEESTSGESLMLSAKAIGAAVVVGLVGAGGAVAMGTAIGKCAESMARQPEMASKINSTMMLGIVFIETAIIYALVVAILIIFVL